MITKEQKSEIVRGLVEKLNISNSVYLLDFQGMTVFESIALRKQLKEKGIEFKVAKNTLILRALKEVPKHNLPESVFFGMTGMALSYDDPLAPAKIIKQLFDKTEKPKFKAASVEGQFFDEKQLNLLASLPSKNELIASILGSINAPASGIVGSINAILRDVAYLVEEVAKKQHAA